jgi:Spy/CpxP family protein refolding chaperone
MNAHNAKPWAVLALLSLAVNLFLGGLLVGRTFRPDKPPGDMGPISLLRSSQDLDPAARQIVDRTREKHHKGIRRSMANAARARLAAINALCARDFDEAKAREAFRAFRAETNVAHDTMQESLIEAAKQMTPEQRAVLKTSLVRSGVREGWKGRGRGPGGRFRDGFPPGPSADPDVGEP